MHSNDESNHTDDEHYEWGARHGFEDHYQSEDIISQLANVSLFLRFRCLSNTSLRPR
jgi:hypothetical protein